MVEIPRFLDVDLGSGRDQRGRPLPRLGVVRMSRVFPWSYKQIHIRVTELRGPASDYDCLCGEPAAEWAYQFTGDPELRDEQGRNPHSADPDDYEPMCRRCHLEFDRDHDPILAENLRKRNSRGGTHGAVIANRKRRRCTGCGKVSTPAGIGKHLKDSGHTGYEDVEGEALNTMRGEN